MSEDSADTLSYTHTAQPAILIVRTVEHEQGAAVQQWRDHAWGHGMVSQELFPSLNDATQRASVLAAVLHEANPTAIVRMEPPALPAVDVADDVLLNKRGQNINSLPVYTPGEHDHIEAYDDLGIDSDKTMTIYGRDDTGTRVLGRGEGVVILSISASEFNFTPKPHDRVFVTGGILGGVEVELLPKEKGLTR